LKNIDSNIANGWTAHYRLLEALRLLPQGRIGHSADSRAPVTFDRDPAAIRNRSKDAHSAGRSLPP
jgi:hypothetical protein